MENICGIPINIVEILLKKIRDEMMISIPFSMIRDDKEVWKKTWKIFV